MIYASNAFVRSIKQLKNSSYCQKILKLCLRVELSHDQLNIVSEKETAFDIKYYFQRKIFKIKSFINS